MGTSLAQATSTERWQALQQLEAAFGQADNNMFFTYNGHSYRSVRVNADLTLQVIDQTTGQVLNLDPIDIYGSAMAAAGTPVQTQPTVLQPAGGALTGQPSTFNNMLGQVGMVSGMLNMAYQIHGVSKYLEHIPKFGIILGSVTAFLSAYQAFQGIKNLYKNFSLGGLLNVAGSALGVATGVNTLVGTLTGYGGGAFSNPVGWAAAGAIISGSLLYSSINSMILNGVTPGGIVTAALSTLGVVVGTNFAIAGIGAMAAAAAGTSVSFSSLLTTALFTGPWGWIAAGAILAFTILWSLFHQPPPEQVAAQNLTGALSPVVWVQGPLAVVALGTVAILMGWAKNSTPPAMASLTVPAYYVNQVLAATGVSNVDLKSKTPTVLVEPGDGRVVIVSPNGTDAHGNPLVTLQTYNVSKNLQFVSSPNVPPEGAYIPFFQVVNGHLQTKPNPALVQALNVQDKLLQAILSGTLLTHDALNALNLAAAANKLGVSPNN